MEPAPAGSALILRPTNRRASGPRHRGCRDYREWSSARRSVATAAWKKTGNAEHMIEMTVGQQKPCQPTKAGAAAKQLPLGALSAIHQNPLATRLDQETGMVALGRRNACRCPQEGEREHLPPLSVSTCKDISRFLRRTSAGARRR